MLKQKKEEEKKIKNKNHIHLKLNQPTVLIIYVPLHTHQGRYSLL